MRNANYGSIFKSKTMHRLFGDIRHYSLIEYDEFISA